MEENKNFSINNFDLIRLFAAAQVAHYHIFTIMQVNISDIHSSIIKFLGLFPGVPIFFFISGYLISRSWEKNNSLLIYIANRALRIYPALIFSVLFAITLVYFSGYFNDNDFTTKDIVITILTKITIFQFYNLDFLRNFGDGVLNGSLWTITVELQFYILTPLIYWALNIFDKKNVVLAILIIIFLIFNITYNDTLKDQYSESMIYKLIGVSFLPWFYMFLFGVFVQRNFEFFLHLLKGKFLFLLALYIPFAYLCSQHSFSFGNAIEPIIFFILSCVVFSAAYSKPDLSSKTLKNNDFSYGIYIYHMPIVNFFIFLGLYKSYLYSIVVLAILVFTSVVSWFYLEKKSLSLKKYLVSQQK